MKQSFEELVRVIEKLRSKDGCHWDKEQTMESLMEKIKEEVGELQEALDKKNKCPRRDWRCFMVFVPDD